MNTGFSGIRTFTWDEPISVQRTTVNNTPLHQHSFLEISYITKGSAVHYFQNQSIVVHEGDYFAVNYNEVHKFSPDGDHDFEAINILFKPEFVDPTLKDCRGFEDLITVSGINSSYYYLQESPTKVTYHDHDRSIRAIFEKMYRENAERLPKYNELLRCCLTELIIETLRKIYRENTKGYNDKRITEILNEIQRNFASDLKLQELANRYGYTDSYLSTLFSKKVGIPFHKYLQNVRLTKACELLSFTDRTIEDISGACGYNDVKTFRELFRSRMKKSPSEFRSNVWKETSDQKADKKEL